MFIGREIRRSHAFWRGEQAAELGVTPKSLFGDLLEVNKRRAVLGEFALEFGQSRVIAFERLRAATLSIQQAFLRDVLLAAFVVLAYISQFMTLEPGDLVCTGTPSGVGKLLPGDEVEVEIVGLSRVKNPVASEKKAT